MYEANLKSLGSRALPEWYDEAKFGIFIHWGLFSVPGFAPGIGNISDAFKKDYDHAIAMAPYTEWYENAIKVPGTPSAVFHLKNYGSALYEAFTGTFQEGLSHWDPDEWARIFSEAGAKYVVMVTKHHDGYCLWPSNIKNPHHAGWNTQRDLVGELADAVRARGLRFGVYYSGGIDWSFNREPLLTLGNFMGSQPGGDYPTYALAQVRELITRYRPSILWNDISWPTGFGELLRLFADYYTEVPDGVVNDRWPHAGLFMKLMRFSVVRRLFDWMVKRHIRKKPHAFDGIIPPIIPHSDFRTPEYVRNPRMGKKKWEATRGMSYSFGFNRNDMPTDYTPFETLLADFIDGVAHGGNLLLNVGPRADGHIPDEQLERLAKFGDWLRLNGTAVYGTVPSEHPDTETGEGLPVRFTRKGHMLNLIVLGEVSGHEIRIHNFYAEGSARLLLDGSTVQMRAEGADLILSFTRPLDNLFAPAIVIAGEESS